MAFRAVILLVLLVFW